MLMSTFLWLAFTQCCTPPASVHFIDTIIVSSFKNIWSSCLWKDVIMFPTTAYLWLQFSCTETLKHKIPVVYNLVNKWLPTFQVCCFLAKVFGGFLLKFSFTTFTCIIKYYSCIWAELVQTVFTAITVSQKKTGEMDLPHLHLVCET